VPNRKAWSFQTVSPDRILAQDAIEPPLFFTHSTTPISCAIEESFASCLE
jgi:hypothetical protein